MRPGDSDWHSPVQAPLSVASADEVHWDVETDLLVVGFGGAGVAAALQARELGLDVVAIDREQGGGATEISGGVFYAGGGTRVQRSCGEEDTPENMFEYLRLETQGVVRDETLLRFCQGSAGDLDWLMGHGVPFGGPVWKRKTSYPNTRYFLYHSDNSLLPTAVAAAQPAARGHRGIMRKGKAATGLGGSIYRPLRRAALTAGVVFEGKTEARQLIVDAEGSVIGLRALQLPADAAGYAEHSQCLQRGRRLKERYPFFLPGAPTVHKIANRQLARATEIDNNQRVWRTYRARRGLCLCAGGFVFNRRMMESHCSRFVAGMPLGTTGDDGSGIRLGQSVGGAVRLLDRASAWRFVNPPLAWAQGIIVDAQGQRFVNESAYGATIGDAMVNQAEGKGWLLLDSQRVRESWGQIAPWRVLSFQWQLAGLNLLFAKRRFNNIESLCRRYGFQESTLRQTLSEYARAARGECEDPFRKPREDLCELTFPLHVIDVSLDARLMPCTVLTVGGLAVDENTGAVQGADGSAIPGLYAAGRTAVGIPSHLYVSGLSIADCVFSGRRAARHAVGSTRC